MNFKTHMERHHPSVKSKVGVNRSIALEFVENEPEAKQAKKNSISVLGAKYPFNSCNVCHKGYSRLNGWQLRPLSVVEGHGFQNMINILDPRYSIPGRIYFSQTLIPKMFEVSGNTVKSSLSLARTLALITDQPGHRILYYYYTGHGRLLRYSGKLSLNGA